MKTLTKFTRTSLLLMAVALGTGCTEDTDDWQQEETGDSEPWKAQYTFGSPTINTADYLTSQDGVSADILTNYVMQADLPQVDMEVFGVLPYIPTAPGYRERLSNLSVTVRLMDGSSIDYEGGSEYLEETTYQGQAFHVLSVWGRYTGTPAVRPENFANVNFVFTVEWIDASSERVVHTSQKTIEIFKR